MAAIILAAATIGGAATAKAACTPPNFTSEERRTIPTTRINQSILSKAVVKETNYYRCLKGLKPLAEDPSLIAAAEIHANNMARLNKLSHNLPVAGMRTLSQRFSAANVKVQKVRAANVGTEYRMVFGTGAFKINDVPNCQFTYSDSRRSIPPHSYGSLARSLVKNLYDSSSHRRNILNRQIRRIGAAAHYTPAGIAPCGTYFVSQDFAG